ncbi:MAG TPA: hypothetical protein VFO21_05995 [Vicinamibacterales bacterium]|nr:hypothetical protein [Vicinamibacterales bacterium]
MSITRAISPLFALLGIVLGMHQRPVDADIRFCSQEGCKGKDGCIFYGMDGCTMWCIDASKIECAT